MSATFWIQRKKRAVQMKKQEQFKTEQEKQEKKPVKKVGAKHDKSTNTKP